MTALAYPKNIVPFPASRAKTTSSVSPIHNGVVVNLDDRRMMNEIKKTTGLTDNDFEHMQATRALLEETMGEILEQPTNNYDYPMQDEKHLHMNAIIPEELADLTGNHEIDEVRVVLDQELDTLVEILGEPRVRKLSVLISDLSQTISDTSHAEGLAGGYLISDPEMDF